MRDKQHQGMEEEYLTHEAEEDQLLHLLGGLRVEMVVIIVRVVVLELDKVVFFLKGLTWVVRDHRQEELVLGGFMLEGFIDRLLKFKIRIMKSIELLQLDQDLFSLL
jgi:hypothetical protein